MAQDVLSSEGQLVTASGPLSELRVAGPVLTNHDAIWFGGQDFEGTAGYTSEAATDAAPSHWDFDQTTVERIKWQWTPPSGWKAFTMRVLWINPGAGTGNVVWRYKHLYLNLGGNPTAALTTVNTLTNAAPAVLGTAFNYDDIATATQITTIDLGAGPINPTVLSVIDRFASDAADTCNGDAAIVRVSVTRVA